MSFEAGTRVGPYEIVAPLGAGGMGEVFRARDTRLARDVALKVLPARLANDGDTLARFEREAKAVASLSHPNILSLFDFGRHNGVVYAVTELLDGETLRERLRAGALPTRKATECGIQVAHGLAAAHDKGVVHRDLKPENLFVTRDGQVKILDFGLARQSPGGPAHSDSGSPTEAHQTEPGTVLGTVGYMSPEQVRGQTVDHRSDIFSLGSVLFEMATGAPAFKRETAAETMTAILREDPLEPPEPTSLSARLAPGLERVLRHCLEKSAEERFQSARDLAFDLEALSGSTRSGATVAWEGPARRLRLPPLLAAAAALVILGLGFGLGRALGRRAGSTSAAGGYTQLTFQAAALSGASVTPEGQSFVYVRREGDNGDIYLQRVGGTNAINLTADSPKDDSEPAFSPDGSQIVFRSERRGGGLFVMGATGESVKRLSDLGFDPAWAPDGREVVFSTESLLPFWPYGRSGVGELWVLTVASGEKRRLTPEGLDAVEPSWSPHGDRIAFWGLRAGGQRDLFTVSRTGDGKSVVSLTDDPDLDWNPVWSPDGRFVYFSSDRGGTLGVWRIPIDEASGRGSGPPEPVPVPFPAAGYLSFTRDGRTLLLVGSFGTDSIERVGFDPKRALAVGDLEPVFATSLRLFFVAASPDGGELALSTGGRQEDIYTIRADGSGLRQLTTDAFKDRGPVFLPGGKGLLFYTTRSGRYEVWSMQLDGSGAKPVAASAKDEFTNPALSRDGSQFAVTLASGAGTAVARLGGADPVAPELIPAGPEGESLEYAAWSRDGRRLAGVLKSHSGRRRPAIYSLDSKSYRTFEIEASEPLFWVDEDRTLVFWTPNEIEALDVASGRVHAVLPASGRGRSNTTSYTFTLSGDERSLFLVRWLDHADVWQVSLP